MRFSSFPLFLSLQVAAIATVLSVVLGIWLAWILASRKFWGKEAVDAVIALPLVFPPTVLGYYLLIVLARPSPLGRLYEQIFSRPLVFTWQAAVLASTLHAIPLLVKSSRAAFENADPVYGRAARSLGASEWRVLRRVTLPLSRRPIVAAAVIAFARSLGDFGATLMIAGDIPGRTQTAAIAIYDAVEGGNMRLAGALAFSLSLIGIGAVYLSNKLEHRRAA